MLISYLIKTWLIGIAIAAPIGPIGMLCIRKTLELGLLGTIAVGFGAALADALYGLIAGLGLTVITHFLLAETKIIKIIGGLLLLSLAVREMYGVDNSSEVNVTDNKTKKITKLTITVFFLTLTNPLTILSFIAVFASISSSVITPQLTPWIVLGIFLGSMTWWLILGTMICYIKQRLPGAWLQWIKYLSGLIIGGFGCWAVISGVVNYW